MTYRTVERTAGSQTSLSWWLTGLWSGQQEARRPSADDLQDCGADSRKPGVPQLMTYRTVERTAGSQTSLSWWLTGLWSRQQEARRPSVDDLQDCGADNREPDVPQLMTYRTVEQTAGSQTSLSWWLTGLDSRKPDVPQWMTYRTVERTAGSQMSLSWWLTGLWSGQQEARRPSVNDLQDCGADSRKPDVPQLMTYRTVEQTAGSQTSLSWWLTGLWSGQQEARRPSVDDLQDCGADSRKPDVPQLMTYRTVERTAGSQTSLSDDLQDCGADSRKPDVPQLMTYRTVEQTAGSQTSLSWWLTGLWSGQQEARRPSVDDLQDCGVDSRKPDVPQLMTYRTVERTAGSQTSLSRWLTGLWSRQQEARRPSADDLQDCGADSRKPDVPQLMTYRTVERTAGSQTSLSWWLTGLWSGQQEARRPSVDDLQDCGADSRKPGVPQLMTYRTVEQTAGSQTSLSWWLTGLWSGQQEARRPSVDDLQDCGADSRKPDVPQLMTYRTVEWTAGSQTSLSWWLTGLWSGQQGARCPSVDDLQDCRADSRKPDVPQLMTYRTVERTAGSQTSLSRWHTGLWSGQQETRRPSADDLQDCGADSRKPDVPQLMTYRTVERTAGSQTSLSWWLTGLWSGQQEARRPSVDDLQDRGADSRKPGVPQLMTYRTVERTAGSQTSLSWWLTGLWSGQQEARRPSVDDLQDCGADSRKPDVPQLMTYRTVERTAGSQASLSWWLTGLWSGQQEARRPSADDLQDCGADSRKPDVPQLMTYRTVERTTGSQTSLSWWLTGLWSRQQEARRPSVDDLQDWTAGSQTSLSGWLTGLWSGQQEARCPSADDLQDCGADSRKPDVPQWMTYRTVEQTAGSQTSLSWWLTGLWSRQQEARRPSADDLQDCGADSRKPDVPQLMTYRTVEWTAGSQMSLSWWLTGLWSRQQEARRPSADDLQDCGADSRKPDVPQLMTYRTVERTAGSQTSLSWWLTGLWSGQQEARRPSVDDLQDCGVDSRKPDVPQLMTYRTVERTAGSQASLSWWLTGLWSRQQEARRPSADDLQDCGADSRKPDVPQLMTYRTVEWTAGSQTSLSWWLTGLWSGQQEARRPSVDDLQDCGVDSREPDVPQLMTYRTVEQTAGGQTSLSRWLTGLWSGQQGARCPSVDDLQDCGADSRRPDVPQPMTYRTVERTAGSQTSLSWWLTGLWSGQQEARRPSADDLQDCGADSRKPDVPQLMTYRTVEQTAGSQTSLSRWLTGLWSRQQEARRPSADDLQDCGADSRKPDVPQLMTYRTVERTAGSQTSLSWWLTGLWSGQQEARRPSADDLQDCGADSRKPDVPQLMTYRTVERTAGSQASLSWWLTGLWSGQQETRRPSADDLQDCGADSRKPDVPQLMTYRTVERTAGSQTSLSWWLTGRWSGQQEARRPSVDDLQDCGADSRKPDVPQLMTYRTVERTEGSQTSLSWWLTGLWSGQQEARRPSGLWSRQQEARPLSVDDLLACGADSRKPDVSQLMTYLPVERTAGSQTSLSWWLTGLWSGQQEARRPSVDDLQDCGVDSRKPDVPQPMTYRTVERTAGSQTSLSWWLTGLWSGQQEARRPSADDLQDCGADSRKPDVPQLMTYRTVERTAGSQTSLSWWLTGLWCGQQEARRLSVAVRRHPSGRRAVTRSPHWWSTAIHASSPDRDAASSTAASRRTPSSSSTNDARYLWLIQRLLCTWIFS